MPIVNLELQKVVHFVNLFRWETIFCSQLSQPFLSSPFLLWLNPNTIPLCSSTDEIFGLLKWNGTHYLRKQYIYTHAACLFKWCREHCTLYLVHYRPHQPRNEHGRTEPSLVLGGEKDIFVAITWAHAWTYFARSSTICSCFGASGPNTFCIVVLYVPFHICWASWK